MTRSAPAAGYRPTRRVQQRAEALAAIKATALEHLRAHGPAALSLRAVARDLGMSSPGLYRYYGSRDELLTALIADAYDALADALVAARDGAGTPLRTRFVAVCEAYFDWAAAHRPEFGLIFGTPVPGYAAPADGPTTAAAGRFSAVFLDLLAESRGGAPGSAKGSDSRDEALQAALLWTRLHGVLVLGLNGHLLPSRLDEAAVRTLYRRVITSCMAELHL